MNLNFDWPKISEILLTGLISSLVALIGAYVTYRLTLRGNRILKEELEEKTLERELIRDALLKGVSNPAEEIRNLKRLNKRLEREISIIEQKMKSFPGGPLVTKDFGSDSFFGRFLDLFHGDAKVNAIFFAALVLAWTVFYLFTSL